MHFLWWIIVGLVAGWATGKIMKGGGYGFLTDTALGIVGALVGGYIAGLLGISPAGGLIYTILIAIAGAVLVVFVFRLITGKRG
ncbi:MAG: GlsB/YeaQ/YmgE family stress response membrane protein [Terracidiphilus sp.]